MSVANYIEILKSKKSSRWSNLSILTFNFPGAPIGARLTGQIVYMLDSRSINPAALSAVAYEITINGSSFPDLNRVSWPSSTSGYEPGVTENAFYLYHQPCKPWAINDFASDIGLIPSTQAVGTVTETRYTRAISTDPWAIDHVNTDDYTSQFFTGIKGGGHPISGGRGSDSPEKKTTIYSKITGGIPAGINWDNIFDSPAFPLFHGGFVTDDAEIPYPWDDSWPDVSSTFTEYFNLWKSGLEDPLSFFPYDTTGSFCDMKMEWIY